MFMVFLCSCFKRRAALLRCVRVFKWMHILETSSSDSPAVLLEEKDEVLQKLVWLYQETCWWGCARNT